MGEPLTPAQRSLRARIAANARHSRGSGKDAIAPARRGFERRFERLAVDPGKTMDPGGPEYAAALAAIDPAELARRVDKAMRSYMQQLAFRRSRAASERSA